MFLLTHLPLSFLCPKRRISQEDSKGVLLLKCLCHGEEEDERGRGISRVLATQDSPSSSLHHIEMEMSLHPALRNDHHGGEKREEKPRWVCPLKRKAASPMGAGGKPLHEESTSWPQLARSQGRMAAELARRLPEVERPPGGGFPTEPRGQERPAPPQPPVSPPRPARRGSAPRPWPGAGAV